MNTKDTKSPKNQGDGCMTKGFELLYWVWAVLGLPLLTAIICLVIYNSYPTMAVQIGSVVAILVAFVLGYKLANFLRKNSKKRGGMAGAMATHATPDLDRESKP